MALVIAALALLCAGVPAGAGAYVYAGQRKHINCGILAVSYSAGGVPANKADIDAVSSPYPLFFVLENLVSLKPTGWTLENPISSVSAGFGEAKNDPNYWVINLSVTTNLSRMNLLYLPVSGNVRLSDDDCEKLRRFVDGGGVLWIDKSDRLSTLDFNDTFFIRDFVFRPAGGGFDMPANRHHPILTIPLWLTNQEIAGLGATPGKSDCDPGYVAGGWASRTSEPSVFDVLLPIVENTSSRKPSVAANVYGSGRVVATANFVGRGCLLPFPSNMPSAKFVFNTIAWASSYTTLRKDPRHTGYAIDTIGGNKLVEQWTLNGVGPIATETSPIIYKNVVFYTGMLSGVSTLFAVDLLPYNDLDQNGNPDDGCPDAMSPWGGSPPDGVDLIWFFRDPEGAAISSPTIATVQNPLMPDQTIEAVLVTSTSGKVHVLNAFPHDPDTGILLPDPSPPNVVPPLDLPGGAGAGSGIAFPPLYVNGWVYAVAGDGRLSAVNPSLQAWGAAHNTSVAYRWAVPTTADTGFTSVTPRTAPAFAFTQNQSSGAVVGIVYWCVSPPSMLGVTNPELNDYIYGVPVYVSNDRLRRRQTSSSGIDSEFQITYREGNISPSPKPKVWYRTAGGTVFAIPDGKVLANRGIVGGLVDSTSNRPGSLVVQGVDIPSDAAVYATYGLDYAYSGLGIERIVQPRVRVALVPRANAANQVPPTQITASPALGPDNTMFLTGKRSSSGQGGGSVYGLINDGNTQTTSWHYYLHSGCSLPAGMNTTVGTIPGSVVDRNGVAMMRPQSFSSPAYAGDKVFVTVSGDGEPAGALLCFKARSDFVVRLTQSGGYGEGGRPIRQAKRLYSPSSNRRMSVKVWQPNLMMETGGGIAVQPLLAAIPVPSDMIDYDRGTITFSNFDRLHLRGTGMNFMQTNTFSPSLPVFVFLDNVEVPVDWSTWAPSVRAAAATGGTVPQETGDAVDLSGWNNLLWYYVVPPGSGGISSSPIVVGNVVYFITNSGTLYAINTDTGETQGGPIDAKNLLWEKPLGAGVGSGASGGPNVSCAGANGALLVPAGDGLHAFGNPMSLVADNNRVVELDGAGEVAWAVDSISWPVSVPTSASTPTRAGPINKPARVKYTSEGDVLVVNSGANQVAWIYRTGMVRADAFTGGKFVRWMFDKFCDPSRILRPGQPTQLSSPTDAVLWSEVEAGAEVVHCLIADSGNHRVVDLVYRMMRVNSGGQEQRLLLDRLGRPIGDSGADPERYDEGGFVLPELNWVSRTESMNQRYIFNCIQKVTAVERSGGAVTAVRDQIWAAVANYATGTDLAGPSRIGEKGLGGAIVGIAYRDSVGYGQSWDYQPRDASGNDVSGQIIARCDRVGPRPLANPRFFHSLDMPDGSRHLFVCDNYGVCEIIIAPDGTMSLGPELLDMDYRNLLRDVADETTGTKVREEAIKAPLLATSVQALPNGHWLIANGFSGPASGASQNFGGEVFQYDPVKRRIEWSSPGLVCPTAGAPWRQMMKNSYSLEQPRSAMRRF